MRLIRARVRKYRSIMDTGYFEVETDKTIFVGPNEAGKSAVLRALQQINAPEGVDGFDPLRDYPRSKFNDITKKLVDPSEERIVEGQFSLDEEDIEQLSEEFKDCEYVFWRKLDNSCLHSLNGGPEIPTYGDLKKDLKRLCAHVDTRVPRPEKEEDTQEKPSVQLYSITKYWTDKISIQGDSAEHLKNWLEKVYTLIDENNSSEEERYDRLMNSVLIDNKRSSALKTLYKRMPIFVLFNNYFRVRPTIHLGHLATRIEEGLLDDKQYDYGNECLLKLLGFTPRELSDLGKVAEPPPGDLDALQKYKDQLDNRQYSLNAASVRLTNEIGKTWLPDPEKDEADQLSIRADQQYLKVVVVDDLGVEIELDQRSEGYQWLVSFFVVFFAEAVDKHKNAILLLDEPGLSLHGLKQRDFRKTISRLAEKNQTLYTTHSPFLVGPDELDLVRVVEMTERKVGTKVHTNVMADDPASLLPLQEALGYDLAQSLFSQQRNLVLEGLTDYWYLESVSLLLREAKLVDLNDKIALISANTAGKVVYYATILHAHNLKVAALLDSDSAGDQAAQQDVLVHKLGNKNILRTKDAYVGQVSHPEIEDLLRDTLVKIAKADLTWDIEATANAQPKRPIVDVFTDEISDFSKYKLAKAFLRWARTNEAKDLSKDECAQ